MKTDNVKTKKGLLGTIWNTMTGDKGRCCNGSACCGTNSNTKSETKGTEYKIVKIYDPPMCCSTGVCGTSVSSALVEFAGALKTLANRGIVIERYNLAQQPQAFTENPQVKELLNSLGKDGLPFIFINDELKISGRYPKSKELFDLLGLNGATKKADGCCTEGSYK